MEDMMHSAKSQKYTYSLIKKTLAVILVGAFLSSSCLADQNNKLAPQSQLNSEDFQYSFTVGAICKHVEHDGNLDDGSYLNDVLTRLGAEKNSNITVLPNEIIIEIPTEGLAIRYFDPTKANVITPYSDISKLETKIIGPRLNRQIIRRVKALRAPEKPAPLAGMSPNDMSPLLPIAECYDENKLLKDKRNILEIFLTQSKYRKKYGILKDVAGRLSAIGLTIDQYIASATYYINERHYRSYLRPSLSLREEFANAPEYLRDLIIDTIEFSNMAYEQNELTEDARYFLWKSGEREADLFIEGYLRDGEMKKFDQRLPLLDKINQVEGINSKPMLDVASGQNIAFFMRSMTSGRYILADRSFFIEAFLNRIKKRLDIGDNVEIRRVDIKHLEEAFSGDGYRHIRLGNIDGYVEGLDAVTNFIPMLLRKIVPRGTISYEHLYPRSDIEYYIPTVDNIKKQLFAQTGWVEESGTYADYDNDSVRYFLFRSNEDVTKSDTSAKYMSPADMAPLYHEDGGLTQIIGPDDLKDRFKESITELEHSPARTTLLLGKDSTINELISGIALLKFEVAIYSVQDLWYITKGVGDQVMLPANVDTMAHNHPNAEALPSTGDLMYFKRGGIGLIVSGYEHGKQHITLFKTPKKNPETNQPFTSDEEMKAFFRQNEEAYANRKSEIMENLKPNFDPVNLHKALEQCVTDYLKKCGISIVVFASISEEAKKLTISEFIEKYEAYISPVLKSSGDVLRSDTSAKEMSPNETVEKRNIPLNIVAKNLDIYVNKNEAICKDTLGENKPATLVRVPVEAIESIGIDNISDFLATFQAAPNGYIELYHMSGTGEVSESVYQKYGLQKKSLPKDFKRTRENTVTLFPALKGEEIDQSAILSRLGNINITPEDTILSPIGLQHDPAGLIRATILGLKMMDIAREIKEKGINITKDQAFKDRIQLEILEQLKNVCDADDLKNFNLTPDDIIALATGTINNIIASLKKLIRLLPIAPIDAEELRQIYEHAKAVITAA